MPAWTSARSTYAPKRPRSRPLTHPALAQIASLLAAVLLLMIAPASVAIDLVEARAVWRDDSASADFETARSQPYTEFATVFTGGYTHAAHWIRLRLRATDEPTLLLRVRPHYLDDIRLYDPAQSDPGGLIQPRLSGDTHPASEPTLMSTNHVFLISGSREPRDVWLRLTTTSTHLLQVDARPLASALNAEHWQLLAQSMLLALYALSAVWALTDWAGRRDPIMLLFAGKQMVLTVQVLFFTGLARLLLDNRMTPLEISNATSIMNLLAVITGFFFELRFLGEFKPPRWLYLTSWVCWLPSLAALVVALNGHYQTALQINSTLLLVIGILTASLAFSGQAWNMPRPEREPLVPRIWLRGFYTLVFIATTFTATAFLDLIEAGEWSLISSLAYGLISGVLIIGLLQTRANRLARSQRDREERLRSAEASARAERARREEQSRFLAMLTHELKTPLSVIRMALGSSGATRTAMIADALRAVDDMRAVIDRCVQADRLEEGASGFAPTAVDLDEFIQEVTHHVDPATTRIHFGSRAGVIRTDPTLLKMILSNLIDNAMKYRLPDSIVEIVIDGDPTGVRIAISNSPGAAGWPDAHRVFEKYYRSPGAHRETGSGLGLYLVSMLARLTGGAIRYLPTDTLVKFELWMPRSTSS